MPRSESNVSVEATRALFYQPKLKAKVLRTIKDSRFLQIPVFEHKGTRFCEKYVEEGQMRNRCRQHVATN